MAKPAQIVLDGTVLNIPLEDRLDTTNATKLIEKLNRYQSEEITSVIFDATKLKYIASSGIRAVLFVQQLFDEEPNIEIKGASEDVYKVFEMTGITSFVKFV